MSERGGELERFLAGTPWAEARRTALAGDASARRYDRLTLPNGDSCVLMDAPCDTGESVAPFVRMARHLTSCGFSAPAILAEDAARGFLLLEDFGDGVFARLLADGAEDESRLYEAAVDALVALHHAPAPESLTRFTPALMAEQAGLVFETYACNPAPRDAFCRALETILERETSGPTVLILRDFHADNLMWLPRRSAMARVGMLDFQDAMRGPAGYDLVSLIHDARRDVAEELADRLAARFAAAAGLEAGAFTATRAVLSAQRNLRILGVFARLARQNGKTGYLGLMPRVWSHLTRAMRHPSLAPLAPFIDSLPPPAPDHLARLRSP